MIIAMEKNEKSIDIFEIEKTPSIALIMGNELD